jgi:DNA polymerase
MTDSTRDSQQRAWHALAIGPIWRHRGSAVATSIAAPVPDRTADPIVEPIAKQIAAPSVAIDSARQTLPMAAANVADLNWDQLTERAMGCRACRLCESRTQVVFGVGARAGGWMIVGEAPGQEEDLRGEPFVGQAGRLLDAMLASVGLSRSQHVYIANVLKCRPPRNRDPQPDEIAQCAPYLRRQIELVDPRLIIVMGRFAAQTLLQTGSSIGSLRGRVHRYALAEREVPVIVTYHPAYLLRSLPEKAKAWVDLCLAKQVFGGAAGAA